MSTLTFTSNKTLLRGKQGKLKQDSSGSYEVLAGAYNVANNVGDIYLLTERVKKLFVKSTMMEKLNKNQLYGEGDHPSLDEFRSKARTEQQAIQLWINRLGQIQAKAISHQITSVALKPLDIVKDGRPVWGVFLGIKPLHPVLKQSLADPEQNTAFSVRSFVDRFIKLGEMFCEAKDIITYDWVPHGGISLATKYNTPSLESEGSPLIMESSAAITTDILNGLTAMEESKEYAMAGVESDTVFNTTMIKGLAGWREVPDLSSMVSRNW